MHTDEAKCKVLDADDDGDGGFSLGRACGGITEVSLEGHLPLSQGVFFLRCAMQRSLLVTI